MTGNDAETGINPAGRRISMNDHKDKKGDSLEQQE